MTGGYRVVFEARPRRCRRMSPTDCAARNAGAEYAARIQLHRATSDGLHGCHAPLRSPPRSFRACCSKMRRPRDARGLRRDGRCAGAFERDRQPGSGAGRHRVGIWHERRGARSRPVLRSKRDSRRDRARAIPRPHGFPEPQFREREHQPRPEQSLQPDFNFRGFTASPLLGLPQGPAVYQNGVRINEPFGDTVSRDLVALSAARGASLFANK